ncbi:MAG: UDP-N-acetylmuramate dehydrogenase, partial [Acidobacteriota bacterium]|nr:UDP-N-acetylmuramate dehydrogenase [Acidobacteriota bacterium]
NLEAVAGIELIRNADLARLSTFRIGGRAEVLATVHTEEALRALVRESARENLRFHLVGLGSNVLFPDGRLEGLVVRLAGDFKKVHFVGTEVVAGAALALPKLARKAAERGLAGLEALCGFPSTVGGAVVMNAGCYGTEIKDVMTTCRVVEEDGRVVELAIGELEPGYRTTNLQGGRRIVVSAAFRLTEADPDAVLARIDELNDKRWRSLPMGEPNVGSIFKNPAGDYAGRLIDECGLKGHAIGGARISPKHGNVIVNTGGASSSDVLELMLAAFRAVRARFGVELEPEVILAGNLHRVWRDSCRDRSEVRMGA